MTPKCARLDSPPIRAIRVPTALQACSVTWTAAMKAETCPKGRTGLTGIQPTTCADTDDERGTFVISRFVFGANSGTERARDNRSSCQAEREKPKQDEQLRNPVLAS